MRIDLPNGLSILLGVALVAALTALVGELPTEIGGMTGLVIAAVLGGIAKAIQVWVDAQKTDEDIAAAGMALVERPSKKRQWLVG